MKTLVCAAVQAALCVLYTHGLTLLHSERPKTPWSFGHSECKRVKSSFSRDTNQIHSTHDKGGV